MWRGSLWAVRISETWCKCGHWTRARAPHSSVGLKLYPSHLAPELVMAPAMSSYESSLLQQPSDRHSSEMEVELKHHFVAKYPEPIKPLMDKIQPGQYRDSAVHVTRPNVVKCGKNNFSKNAALSGLHRHCVISLGSLKFFSQQTCKRRLILLYNIQRGWLQVLQSSILVLGGEKLFKHLIVKYCQTFLACLFLCGQWLIHWKEMIRNIFPLFQTFASTLANLR